MQPDTPYAEVRYMEKKKQQRDEEAADTKPAGGSAGEQQGEADLEGVIIPGKPEDLPPAPPAQGGE